MLNGVGSQLTWKMRKECAKLFLDFLRGEFCIAVLQSIMTYLVTEGVRIINGVPTHLEDEVGMR